MTEKYIECCELYFDAEEGDGISYIKTGNTYIVKIRDVDHGDTVCIFVSKLKNIVVDDDYKPDDSTYIRIFEFENNVNIILPQYHHRSVNYTDCKTVSTEKYIRKDVKESLSSPE